MKSLAHYIDLLVFSIATVSFVFGLTGNDLFYSATSPVMSPFTALSLILMAGSRFAERLIETWSKPMTLAIMGIVACGNLTSLWIQLTFPELFSISSNIIPTSAMTSFGLIFFCFYEILIVIRKTPNSAFIVDDILLHLALFPGGLSFLGHILDVPFYKGSIHDPRVGIGVFEMLFMGVYATGAIASNRNLFLWHFLKKSTLNRITFSILFINQYVAPIVTGLLLNTGRSATNTYGIEFYVMIAGVLATLLFLISHAILERK